MTCRNKAKFETWSSAQEAVERLTHNRNFRSLKNYVVQTYFCPQCNSFHIGHTAKIAEKNTRREEAKLQKLILKYIT